jgi:hypothetical protein
MCWEMENVTSNQVLNNGGTDNNTSLVKLTDNAVDNLVYHDPDPTILKLLKLNWGEIGYIKSIVH